MVENQPVYGRYRSIDQRVRVAADELIAIKEAGGRINTQSLKIDRPALIQRIIGLPGGWVRVVKEAGFNPDEERSPRYRPRRNKNNS